MAVNTVLWPNLVSAHNPNQDWADSGEGGLWAVAVWRAENRDAYACVVDTAPVLPVPDVLVGKNALDRALLYWPDRPYTDERYSLPLLGALHLGSTPYSFYSDSRGEYFTVGFEHLTSAMLDTITTLSEIYGVDAEILTFLDT